MGGKNGGPKIIWEDLIPPGFSSIEEFVQVWYVTEKKSLEDLATRLGICRQVLTKRIKSYGIAIRRSGRPSPNSTLLVSKIKSPPIPKLEYDTTVAGKYCICVEDFDVHSRDHEQRSCPNFPHCLTVTAVYDGTTVPCVGCDGSMPMELHPIIQVFNTLLNSEHGKIGACLPYLDDAIKERHTVTRFKQWLSGVDSSKIFLNITNRTFTLYSLSGNLN